MVHRLIPIRTRQGVFKISYRAQESKPRMKVYNQIYIILLLYFDKLIGFLLSNAFLLTAWKLLVELEGISDEWGDFFHL